MKHHTNSHNIFHQQVLLGVGGESLFPFQMSLMSTKITNHINLDYWVHIFLISCVIKRELTPSALVLYMEV